MSNIERTDTNVGSIEEIKRCEQLIKPEHANWIGISNQLAIAGILARIKELEEPTIIQNKSTRSGKPIIKGTRLTVIDVLLFAIEFIKKHEKEFRKNYADISSKQIVNSINYLLENSIPKQKVEEILVKAEVMDYYSLPDVIEDLEKVLGVEDK